MHGVCSSPSIAAVGLLFRLTHAGPRTPRLQGAKPPPSRAFSHMLLQEEVAMSVLAGAAPSPHPWSPFACTGCGRGRRPWDSGCQKGWVQMWASLSR